MTERVKLSTIIDRPVRILETGQGHLNIHDAASDELLGQLILTVGAPELYDCNGNFFQDDTE